MREVRSASYNAGIVRWIILGAAATVLLPVVVIAERSYRAAADLFAPAVASALLSDPGATRVAGLRNVSFHACDGDAIAGWFVPSRNGAAVIVTHGTNDDRASMLVEVRLLSAAGFGVLAFDWPGLGRSGGEVRWGPDAQCALKAGTGWLAARPGVDAARIGGLGFSMGGVMLARFAAGDRRIRAVVLEGTPPDFDDYVAYHYGRWGPISKWPARAALWRSDLLDESLSPEHLIAAIAPRPVFLIGGDRDVEVPQSQVRELYAAARAPKSLWIVSGAQHGHYDRVARDEYANRLIGFFETNLPQRTAGGAGDRRRGCSRDPPAVRRPAAAERPAPHRRGAIRRS